MISTPEEAIEELANRDGIPKFGWKLHCAVDDKWLFRGTDLKGKPTKLILTNSGDVYIQHEDTRRVQR